MGFLVAPGVAVLAFSIYSPLYEGLTDYRERIIRTAVTTAWVVYPMTFVIGLPAYFWLRSRLRPSILNCVLAGAGVAALPWLFLSVLMAPDEASTGNLITVHHHMLTLAGWAELLQFVGGIGLLGALAGGVFWLLAALGVSKPALAQSDQPPA